MVVRHTHNNHIISSSSNNKNAVFLLLLLKSIITTMAAVTAVQLFSLSSTSSALFVTGWSVGRQLPLRRIPLSSSSTRSLSRLLLFRQNFQELDGAVMIRRLRDKNGRFPLISSSHNNHYIVYRKPTTRNFIQAFSSSDSSNNNNNNIATTDNTTVAPPTTATTSLTATNDTIKSQPYSTTVTINTPTTPGAIPQTVTNDTATTAAVTTVDETSVPIQAIIPPPPPPVGTGTTSTTTAITNVDTSNICGSSILAIDPADIVISIEPSLNSFNTAANATVESTVNGSNSSSTATTTSSSAASKTESSSNPPIPSQSELLRRLPFVSMFRGSANYIANHRNTVAVYHIPGGLLCNQNNNTLSLSSPPSETEMIFRDLMNDVALTWLLGIKIVIVVGCRHQIEQRLLEKQKRQQEIVRLYNTTGTASTNQQNLTVPTTAIPSTSTSTTTTRNDYDVITSQHGLRVTSPEILRIVKEEAGYVRFEVERQLARSLRLQGGGTAATATTASNGNSISSSSSSSSNGSGGFIDNAKGKLPPSSMNGIASNTFAAGANSGANGHHNSAYFDGNVVSGNFYSAQPFGILDGVDYQYSGFVRRVEVEKIRQLHASRDICLLTTLGVSPSGEVFNVNSESLAAIVAGAMEASKVVYFTEQEVYLRHKVHGNKIQSLRLNDGLNFLNYYGIRMHSKGFVTMSNDVEEQERRKTLTPQKMDMLLKIGWCTGAIGLGVKRAHIITPQHGALLQELYTRDGSGTLISADLYEGIRRATVLDVSSIHAIIAPLIAAGTLIDRPKAQLEKDIDQYYIYTRDKDIIACGQLKKFENGFAEIGCLVVNKDFRSRGRGDAMLGYLERLSLLNECSNIFVLSTQTMEWFVERGFDEAVVAQLPPSRQTTYNHKRASKIYLKKIESDRDLDASELWWNR